MTAREQALSRFWPWWGWYAPQIVDESLEPRHVRDAYVAGYVAGGAYALRCSAAIARLVPTIDLFNDLLGAELEQRANELDVTDP